MRQCPTAAWETRHEAQPDNPMADDKRPLLSCEVWEHAYSIDDRNAHAQYIEAFWHRVNRHFVAQNMGG